MRGRLLARLASLSRQQWWVATWLGLAVALALLGLLLGSGFARLAGVRAQCVQAEQATQAAQLLDRQRHQLEAELAVAANEQAGRLAGPGGQQALVKLLGQINEIAERHQVTLERLTPAPVRRVAMLDELPVDVELTGPYSQVSAMLLEVAPAMPEASVSAFQIERAGSGMAVKMRARLSVYLEGGRTQ